MCESWRDNIWKINMAITIRELSPEPILIHLGHSSLADTAFDLVHNVSNATIRVTQP